MQYPVLHIYLIQYGMVMYLLHCLVGFGMMEASSVYRTIWPGNFRERKPSQILLTWEHINETSLQHAVPIFSILQKIWSTKCSLSADLQKFLPLKVSPYTLTGAPTMGMVRHICTPCMYTCSWTNHCSSIDETNNFNHLTVHWGQYSTPIYNTGTFAPPLIIYMYILISTRFAIKSKKSYAISNVPQSTWGCTTHYNTALLSCRVVSCTFCAILLTAICTHVHVVYTYVLWYLVYLYNIVTILHWFIQY